MSSFEFSKQQAIELILEKETLNEFLNYKLFDDASKKGYMYELIAELSYVFGQTDLPVTGYKMMFGKSDSLKYFSH
jgi:hypothetical protein